MSRFCVAAFASLLIGSLSDAITILPLGDSITAGCGSQAGPSNNWTAVCGGESGGYRAPLWAALNASGFNTTFVGTQTAGPAWLPQRSHEGHPGWRIAQLTGIIGKWAPLQPDIVLVLLGTNDIGQNHTQYQLTADMTALLNATVQAIPNVRIIIGTVLNMVNSLNPQWQPAVQAYNAALPAIASNFGASIADLNADTGLCTPETGPLQRMCAECNPPACPAGTYDRVHPTAAGYSLMAGVWAAALAPVLEAVQQRA